MANLSETTTYDAAVYQIETTDQVLGGSTGTANKQAISLANRTNWLRSKALSSLRFDSKVDCAGTYNISASDVSKLLYVPNMGNIAFQFPDAASFPQGQPFTIMASDGSVANSITLTANGSDLFFTGAGASSPTHLMRTGQRLVLMATGSQWLVLMNMQSTDHGRIPAGATMAFSGSAAPSGWLKCNGSVISRTAYADLFAAIGTTWGVGDGSTTFKLPDHRGVFLRGLDEGRGMDPGRAIGSYQADDIKSHTHVLNTSNLSGVSGGSQFASAVQTDTPRIVSDATGGIETVVKNNACLYIIKY